MDEGGETPKPTSEPSPKPEGAATDQGMGLKFTTERFSISLTQDKDKALAERLKEVANTPPEQLLKRSQWRRDLLGSEQGGVEKPLSPEQALPVVGVLIESYLNTIKEPHNPPTSSEAEGISWSPDDMTRFVNTLREKGVIDEQGGAKLNDNIKKYKDTGVYPPNNTNQPPTK